MRFADPEKFRRILYTETDQNEFGRISAVLNTPYLAEGKASVGRYRK